MIWIEIARRHYLLYLLLPHPLRVTLLSEDDRARLDKINAANNERMYSGSGASAYDRIHRYEECEHHEYPGRALITQVWGRASYGRALDIGAGGGYFTSLIAERAESVLAVEPVPDMQRVLRARCAAAGLHNVHVIDAKVLDLERHVPPGSIDSAFVIQSLHHFHRWLEVFAKLRVVVRRGGRLFLLESHHNLKRILRLLRKYATTYRSVEFWRAEKNWATHDFVARREILALCRHGGFDRVRIRHYWILGSRRSVTDARRRFGLEHAVGRLPIARHFAAVLGVEARRCSGA
jgi:ubiquinone/menaquinone biosynthesis C-methylase UbiE